MSTMGEVDYIEKIDNLGEELKTLRYAVFMWRREADNQRVRADNLEELNKSLHSLLTKYEEDHDPGCI